MKNSFTIIAGLAFAILFTACPDAGDLPDCIVKRISAIEAETKHCPGSASVKQYQFQDKTVYVFNTGNCIPDAAAEVVDAQCATICYVGGFRPNNQECQGMDFRESAKEEKVLWQN
jgi:hypothetical protein